MRFDNLDMAGLEKLCRKHPPLGADDLAALFLSLDAQLDGHDLEKPWRGDGWPAGWCVSLEALLVAGNGPWKPLIDVVSQLGPLLRTTLSSAMLRLGYVGRHGLGDDILGLLADHCVRQLEFDDRDNLKVFYTWELGAIRGAWPESEWRPALVEAAVAAPVNFEVWSPVRDDLAPYASREQLIQLAACHSQLAARPGRDLFGAEQAFSLVLDAGTAGMASLRELADTLAAQDDFLLSRLIVATVGFALLCDSLGHPYPRGYDYLWRSLIGHDEQRFLLQLSQIVRVLPLDELGETLRAAVDVAETDFAWKIPRRLVHPESGERIEWYCTTNHIHIRLCDASDAVMTEMLVADNAKKAELWVVAKSLQRMEEGWIDASLMERRGGADMEVGEEATRPQPRSAGAPPPR